MPFSRFPDIFVVKFGVLGVLEVRQLPAIFGFARYIFPLRTLRAALVNPIHTLLYIFFVTSICTIFSKTSARIEVSGCRPRDIAKAAKQIKEQQVVMAGHREGSMFKELKRVVPTAAVLGGAILGLLSVAADLMCD